jgi:hypothetical protein
MRTDGKNIINDQELNVINTNDDDLHEDIITQYAEDYLTSIGLDANAMALNDYTLIALPRSLYVKLLHTSHTQNKSFSKVIGDSITSA